MSEYACKHCRRVVFTSSDLMEHVPESHQIATRRKLKDARTKMNNSSVLFNDGCSSFFLADTLEWMDEQTLAEGKIHCPNPKCAVRLGSFSWSGSQCSCGTWVTPSIKLTKSRVDLKLNANCMPIISTTLPTTTNQVPIHTTQMDNVLDHGITQL